jgi:hypothetical protein
MDAQFPIRHLSAKVVVASVTTKHRKGHPKMKITTIGIDLAKNIFQVQGVNEHGTVNVLNKCGFPACITPHTEL